MYVHMRIFFFSLKKNKPVVDHYLKKGSTARGDPLPPLTNTENWMEKMSSFDSDRRRLKNDKRWSYDIMTWPTLGPAWICQRSDIRTPVLDVIKPIQNQSKLELLNQNLTSKNIYLYTWTPFPGCQAEKLIPNFVSLLTKMTGKKQNRQPGTHNKHNI